MTHYEVVGKVRLDYANYSGNDLYSEGPAEDRLLKLVQERDSETFNHLIAEEGTWNTLYHLSHVRGNIIDFLPIDKNMKVLEVGSGCGAITGTLAKKAGSVTCIELSQKRSLINAFRHQSYDNIEILVGNFQDIEKSLSLDYDYIMLIGVLEYAASYMDMENPYEEMLRLLKGHLKDSGSIAVAIENQYGLKYFSGCREDHTGKFFDGITGYLGQGGKGPKTFSRDNLIRLASKAGLDSFFYYPYPDYKLPISIWSDLFLPKEGDFSENKLVNEAGDMATALSGYSRRNFEADRFFAFDEALAFNEAARNGSFPFFSNSFLVIMQPKENTSISPIRPVYSRHASDRAPEFQIRTDIVEKRKAGQGNDSQFVVRKLPLTRAAEEHLRVMAGRFQLLDKEFRPAGFLMNSVQLTEASDGALTHLEFEYINGESFSCVLDRLKDKGDTAAFEERLLSFISSISSLATEDFIKTTAFEKMFGHTDLPKGLKSLPLSDIDLLFSNILCPSDGSQPVLIDYEWTADFPIPVSFILWRSLHYYFKYRMANPYPEIERFLRIDHALQETFLEMELSFQRYIASETISLDTMHLLFGKDCVPFESAYKCLNEIESPENPLAYFDFGNGFHEENRSIIRALRDKYDHIKATVQVPEGCKALRFDPVNTDCAIEIESAQIDGQPLKKCLINGLKIDLSLAFFPLEDPQLIFEGMEAAHKFTISYSIRRLQPSFRDAIAERIVLDPNEISKLNSVIDALKRTRKIWRREKLAKEIYDATPDLYTFNRPLPFTELPLK